VNRQALGKEVYRNLLWAVYKKNNLWIYLGLCPVPRDKSFERVAVFSHDYRQAEIFNYTDKFFLEGCLDSLTLFPTDQLVLAQVLADRQGCYLHSSGVILGGNGLLFVGYSGAGKSTMVKMLKRHKAEILCDDRMIIRKQADGFRIYGTWSSGEVPDVSPNSAPFKAVIFLEKSHRNTLIKLADKKEIAKRILACLVRPVETHDWWDKTALIINSIAEEVPAYVQEFDKGGGIVKLLKQL